VSLQPRALHKGCKSLDRDRTSSAQGVRRSHRAQIREVRRVQRLVVADGRAAAAPCTCGVGGESGSTAYSFSAGGPIVSPSAEGLLVVPAARHSAFNRALFLFSGERLALQVLPTSSELAVEADGRVVGYLLPGDVVEVQLLPSAARVVRLGRTTFYQRVQRRLRLTGSVEAD
jgi:hypothetical protein